MAGFVDKIAAPADVGRVVAEWRTAGLRVVWTNGCFDLLHSGHVRYLEAARRLGDRLIVGLNDDGSVERLKGPTRPVVPLAGRLDVVAALAAVDAVTWFGDDTPLAMILSLRPDVIAKGGDYRPTEVVGGHEAAAWGGRVEILPFVEGHSTSSLVARAGGRTA